MKKWSALLAVAAFAAAIFFFPPFRLFALKAVGRADVCPLANALDADRNLQAQIRYTNDFLQHSKLVTKDPAGYHQWETPRGVWWIPEGNDYVLPFNLAEQEREIYGSGDFAVHPGDVVLDCGGNVGTFTQTALKHGARLVVAFEPAPENIESYRRNFQSQIAAGQVILIPKGVWDKDDVLLLKRDPHNTAADSFVMLKDGTPGVQAPLTTIDEEVAALKLDRVDYMKLDIEGAEKKALDGARATLRKFHPRMSIATEHFDTDAKLIPEKVKELAPGYQVTCGPCMERHDGHVRPDVLYFR
jgi:FkbM family methyltransferase